MKKNWSNPSIEELNISLTSNDIFQGSKSDGIYAGQFGDNPDGWVYPDNGS